jgi:formylglycine-generating enzyme required for sulfatase activity
MADGSAGSGGSGSDSSSTGGPPSCATGGPGVGDCGTAHESCCTSLAVLGGTFYRTYSPDVADPIQTRPPDAGLGLADPATVSSFRLDKYDVTVGRFRRFVAAWTAGWKPSPGSGKHTHLNEGRGLVNANATPDAGVAYETGWLASDDANVKLTDLVCQGLPDFASWTPEVGTREDHPMNCVTWYEAQAFCIWDGGFLPTEAEWEYAAAGGDEERTYPWGSTDPGIASQYAIYGDDKGNCFYPSGLMACSGMSIAPVGTASTGAGRYGQLDLAGNVWQWVIDWFLPTYVACTDSAPLTAPPPDFRLTAVSSRVLRGGSFSSNAQILRPSSRFGASDPGVSTINGGFRCARVP